MLLGCIADDLTGATDLALMLARHGMRTVQIMQVPGPDLKLAAFDAVVVALKTRTCPPAEAADLSLKSADALMVLGARQIFFKYCSTFDSTVDGNIGPVAEALLQRLGGITIACPAFPANRRTIYNGHLFVGDVLLSDSPMKDHPLTPMRDANLVRVLQRQTREKVGLVPLRDVMSGPTHIAAAIRAAEQRGERMLIVDAVTDDNLLDIARAIADPAHRPQPLKLVTGGSGVAMGLPACFATQGLLTLKPPPHTLSAPPGRAAILAGSCSEATRGQVAAAIAAGIPAFRLDPLAIAPSSDRPGQALAWALRQPPEKPVLIYSSADPASVAAAQAKLGRAMAGAIVESALARIAVGLVEAGCRRLIVAGGETSGAVVNALHLSALEIGPEIDPGVPWCRSIGGKELAVALKSGNFGAPEFFIKAWQNLA